MCGVPLHASRARQLMPQLTMQRCFAVAAAEANSLVSSETEMPFEYYKNPFCKPPEGVKKSGNVNPGTILLGIRIENSPYNFSMMVRADGF